MKSTDSERVLSIYKLGLDTRNATFETKVPDWNTWEAKHLQHSRFVFDDGVVKGWVALSAVSTRAVYAGVAEVSVYVDTNYSGKGIGALLMETVINSSEENGIWTLTSSVFPENTATLKLHGRSGFRVVGRRVRIAKLNGLWRDTIILERRSDKIN